MNIEEIRIYCLAKKEATESFPFNHSTLVFKVMNKVFAIIGLERFPLAVHLKCNPDKAIRLREEYEEIVGGYHMNKRHWNTVYFELLPEELLKEMIDDSYRLVVSSLPKYKQNQLNE